MKGLLKKDIALFFNNKRSLLFFVVIALMFSYTSMENGISGGSFVIGYFSLLCGMLGLSTITYDEFDRGMSFLMTLPVKRKTYVVEKYLFEALCLFFGWAVSIVIILIMAAVRGNYFGMAELLVGGAAVLAVLALIVMLMLPVQLKYGGEKSRLVMISMAVIIMILVFGGEKILKVLGIDGGTVINQLLEAASGFGIAVFAAGGILLFLLAAFISYQCSARIMTKKEY